jgi:hypothetical protein
MAASARIFVTVRCDVCDGAIELGCAGLPGFWGYQAYHEFLCPHCGKRGDEKTPGEILSVRAV